MHTFSDLMSVLGLSKSAPHRQAAQAESRHVMVHVTVDAQHATPLRRSLVRDCSGEPWTMRITTLRDTERVRLTLVLPKTAIDGAIRRLTDLLPSAQVSGLLDVPVTPSDGWRDVMDRSVHRGAETVARRADAAASPGVLSERLHADHVLLDIDVPDRDALFRAIGYFLDTRHAISAETVVACLESREALGSTALGEGVAVPHGQIEALHEPMVFYIRPTPPISFDAPDGKPVSDVIALFVPERVSMTHLHLLGEVAEYFCDRRFRELLHRCRSAEEVCRLFGQYQT